MAAAVAAVAAGSSIMAAARRHAIPRATLWCRMKREFPCAKLHTGPPSALLEGEEEAVCGWVAAMTAAGKPQTFKSLALIVKEVVDAAGRRNVFHNNRPSEGWIGKFKKKHAHLFSKKLEATTLRDNITVDDVTKFFYELDYHIESEDLDPSLFLSPQNARKVFNMDEAGVYIPNDDCLSKLLMRRSERCNLQGCGDTRQMVTLVSCGSATGLYMKPLLLFKESRIPFKSGCPGVDNTTFNIGISELGWMDHKAFLYWLQLFEDELVELGVDKPVLLLLDGHSPHVSVTALEYARECGIIMHQIPPHTSHLLQPMFLALYKNLKKSYREVVIENWPKDDKVMNKKQFPAIFMEAWKRTTNSKSLIEGFRETGIIPRNSDIVTNKLVKEEEKTREAAATSTIARTASSEQASSISLSSLQALLSSRAESSVIEPGKLVNRNTDSTQFIQGLQDAIDVIKEYVPKQVRDIYEKWIEERNTRCTSDTLYHIWLCLQDKIYQHDPTRNCFSVSSISCDDQSRTDSSVSNITNTLHVSVQNDCVNCPTAIIEVTSNDDRTNFKRSIVERETNEVRPQDNGSSGAGCGGGTGGDCRAVPQDNGSSGAGCGGGTGGDCGNGGAYLGNNGGGVINVGAAGNNNNIVVTGNGIVGSNAGIINTSSCTTSAAVSGGFMQGTTETTTQYIIESNDQNCTSTNVSARHQSSYGGHVSNTNINSEHERNYMTNMNIDEYDEYLMNHRTSNQSQVVKPLSYTGAMSNEGLSHTHSSAVFTHPSSIGISTTNVIHSPTLTTMTSGSLSTTTHPIPRLMNSEIVTHPASRSMRNQLIHHSTPGAMNSEHVSHNVPRTLYNNELSHRGAVPPPDHFYPRAMNNELPVDYARTMSINSVGGGFPRVMMDGEAGTAYSSSGGGGLRSALKHPLEGEPPGMGEYQVPVKRYRV